MGLGLRHRVGADDVAGGVEAKLGLAGLDLEAGRAAVLPEHRRGIAGDRQRLGDVLGSAAAPGEEEVELIVVEAGAGADAAAVEARGTRPAGGAELDLGRDRQPLHVRRQAAGLLAQRPRQHRLDGTRHVGAVPPPARLEIERRAGQHMSGDVGDVDPDAHPVLLAPGRDRVVEVARRSGIDREGGQLGQVAARALARLRGVRGTPGFDLQSRSEATPAEALRQQPLQRLAGVPRLSLSAPPPTAPLPLPVVAPVLLAHPSHPFRCALSPI